MQIMVAYRTAPDPQETGWPKGIAYIIGNEGCERFSFYGMKAILFVYIGHLLRESGLAAEVAERQALEVVHTFVAGVYALPMIGAVIADRFWGKYPTIVWLSLLYCAGHACLAIFDGNFQGSVAGLVLIAIGSGGIKPCVSAHVGDQFGEGNASKLERVYQAFYFIINFGAFFSTLLIPWVQSAFGFGVAFAIPGILMGVATAWFWMGRSVYVHVPPQPGGLLGLIDVLSGILMFLAIALPMFGGTLSAGYAGLGWASKLALSLVCLAAGVVVFLWRQRRAQDDGFLAVLLYALRDRLRGSKQTQLEPAKPRGFWDGARAHFGDEAAEGPPAVLRIVTVFAMVSFFWALFDQNASSWVAQAQQMDRTFRLFGFELTLQPEQMSAANPALVMLLVPFTTYVVYPGVEKLRGREFTPLQRMTCGMFMAAISFAIVALAQERLDAGQHVHVGAQLLAYLVITFGEVMVSVTGLEFAYTQAPRRMKSLLMGLWLMTASLGNLFVALLSTLEDLPRVQFFWTFAALMLGASLLFGLRAAFYQYRTYVQ